MIRAREALVAAWCALAIAACATRGAAPPAVQPTPPPPTATSTQVMPADRHAEITQLAARIDAQRGQLGLPPAGEPACASACTAAPMATLPSAASCQPSPSDACKDTCTLSDSICSDAKKICDLAAQLAADTWAAGKCASAKQSCDDAHARCCACH